MIYELFCIASNHDFAWGHMRFFRTYLLALLTLVGLLVAPISSASAAVNCAVIGPGAGGFAIIGTPSETGTVGVPYNSQFTTDAGVTVGVGFGTSDTVATGGGRLGAAGASILGGAGTGATTGGGLGRGGASVVVTGGAV